MKRIVRYLLIPAALAMACFISTEAFAQRGERGGGGGGGGGRGGVNVGGGGVRVGGGGGGSGQVRSGGGGGGGGQVRGSGGGNISAPRVSIPSGGNVGTPRVAIPSGGGGNSGSPRVSTPSGGNSGAPRVAIPSGGGGASINLGGGANAQPRINTPQTNNNNLNPRDLGVQPPRGNNNAGVNGGVTGNVRTNPNVNANLGARNSDGRTGRQSIVDSINNQRIANPANIAGERLNTLKPVIDNRNIADFHNKNRPGNNDNRPGNNNNNNNNQWNNDGRDHRHWNHYQNNWNQYGVSNRYRDFYRGSWSGFNSWYLPFGGYNGYGYGGYGRGFGLGLGGGYGAGYGLGNGYRLGGFGVNPWGYNSLAYRWGYNSYYNPYYGSNFGYPYNYSQTISVPYYQAGDVSTTTASDTSATDRDFAAARAAFRDQNYTGSITALNRIIQANPSDTVAHEFRALNLFAMGRYEEAATGLNSLLAVAPGWDWNTQGSLYADVNTYTTQLRKLEAYSGSHPDDAAAHFVLAYQYLVTGHPEAAQPQLEKVVELQPRDIVARQLLNGLKKDDTTAAESKPSLPPNTTDVEKMTDAKTDLTGAWVANRGDQPIRLELQDGGRFQWTATVNNEERKVSGKYAIANDLLVLEDDQGGAMVAHVTSLGDRKFSFSPVGGGSGDVGLTFERK